MVTIAKTAAIVKAMDKTRTKPLRLNTTTLIGGVLVLVFVIVAILAPAPYSPMKQDLAHARETPSIDHRFGTDELGRDILSRVIAGIRITLRISLSTLILSAITGVTIGLVSGYLGGKLDSILMRMVEIQLAIPSMILALVLVSILGASINTLIFVMSLSTYPSFSRLARSLTLQVKESGFVEASIAIGSPQSRVMAKHILPNILPHILVLATLSLGRVVLYTASLGFLGFGGEPGTPELGMMVASARNQFLAKPHMILFPSLIILLMVLGFNLLGDGVRDVMDPRLREK